MSRIEAADGAGAPELDVVLYEKRDWQATITLNRPAAGNSLTLRSFEQVQWALRDAERDDGVAVVVLTGAGDRAFCTGADLHEHWELCQRPRDYVKWIREFIAMQTALVRCGKPTIARLNGLVLGGGNELNLACDLAVAAADVVIRQAGPSRGSVPGIGVTQWLPLVIGDRRARQMVFLCEDITADMALSWGLVNEVVPRGELDAAVDTLTAKLVAKFPECLRYSKVQLNHLKEASWAATAPHAGEWLALHSGSVETYEGMRAFQAKRAVDHVALRERAVRDEWPEFVHGAPVRTCPSCGVNGLPAGHMYCGRCGSGLPERQRMT